ncbi:hypothetical protein Asp14428_61000 [Actinoplanes sp. NBRC 14428]|nr:hypothetical protein Asp14428_61000 [Actinoplanes sp. NBRC 14428]
MTRSDFITDLFIDGEWRPGAGGGRFDVVDPADLSTIARFAIASEQDCLDAVDAAAAAQEGWAATAPGNAASCCARRTRS